MGALRAAECAAYGMEPVGEMARAYASGRLDDDAAVALVHAPPEFGSQPMSEPLVDALGDDRRAWKRWGRSIAARPRRSRRSAEDASSATGRPRRLPKVPG